MDILENAFGNMANRTMRPALAACTRQHRNRRVTRKEGMNPLDAQPNSDVTPMLTARELSHIVPLHPVTILRWAREGKIPHRRLSAKKIVFLPSEINAWLASRSTLYTEPATRAASTEMEAA